ncbi:hypothetical protein ACHAQA_008836 [Verticillium albo-atrum]
MEGKSNTSKKRPLQEVAHEKFNYPCSEPTTPIRQNPISGSALATNADNIARNLNEHKNNAACDSEFEPYLYDEVEVRLNILDRHLELLEGLVLALEAQVGQSIANSANGMVTRDPHDERRHWKAERDLQDMRILRLEQAIEAMVIQHNTGVLGEYSDAEAVRLATSGRYIVTLKPDAAIDLNLHTRWVTDIHARNLQRRGEDTAGLDSTFVFPGFAGYAGAFDDDTLEAIKAHVNVSIVEPELLSFLPSEPSLVTQENPPWGLSAISRANPPVSNSSYVFDSSAGEGTFSYFLDSGIYVDHVDFEGRAVLGHVGAGAETVASDLLHGTIIASIIGGRVHGVAKKTSLIGVRVTGTAVGSLSWFLDGLSWTVNDIVSKDRVGKSVINMSLLFGSSTTVNNAVQAAINAGIPVTASAGNSNVDTADWSPANLPDAITVAASNSNYRRWSRSNWGPTADLFAPGEDILAAGVQSPTATGRFSGTSESAPYVAGVVAYLLGLEGPRTPAQIKARILELAIEGVIADTQGVPNLLLYNGSGA